MISCDPDDHFKLSWTSVGHSQLGLYIPAFRHSLAVTFHNITENFGFFSIFL